MQKLRAGYIDAPRWIHRRRAAAGYTYADTLNRTQQCYRKQQSFDTCARMEPILKNEETLTFKSCDTCTRMERIVKMSSTLRVNSFDTCARTAPIVET